jgi:hypothetical protein
LPPVQWLAPIFSRGSQSRNRPRLRTKAPWWVLLGTMSDGTMFCTGHTSMNINELVSYSSLIKKEFLEEYKSVHGMTVKKGPGRAKVDDPSPSPSPSPSPCTFFLDAPSTTTLTHPRPYPHHRCTIGLRSGGIRSRCPSRGAQPPRSSLGADRRDSTSTCTAPAPWSGAGGMTSFSRSSTGETVPIPLPLPLPHPRP